MDVHIGQLIAGVARKKRLTTQEITEALGTSERNTSYIFNKPDISVRKLWRISDKMNHNFFADLKPVVVPDESVTKWEEIEKLYKTEQVKRISIDIQFPVSLSKELGAFIMQANALGLKMGFKIG